MSRSHGGTEHRLHATENQIGDAVIEHAIDIHRKLGPGLSEIVYEAILAQRLRFCGFKVERQVRVPIEFEGLTFDEGFRADLIINSKVIVELKSIEKLNGSHKKQVLTHIKLAKMKWGYLLNFGEALMKDGIVRSINGSLD